jgi:hypothetical protein
MLSKCRSLFTLSHVKSLSLKSDKRKAVFVLEIVWLLFVKGVIQIADVSFDGSHPDVFTN